MSAALGTLALLCPDGRHWVPRPAAPPGTVPVRASPVAGWKQQKGGVVGRAGVVLPSVGDQGLSITAAPSLLSRLVPGGMSFRCPGVLPEY